MSCDVFFYRLGYDLTSFVKGIPFIDDGTFQCPFVSIMRVEFLGSFAVPLGEWPVVNIGRANDITRLWIIHYPGVFNLMGLFLPIFLCVFLMQTTLPGLDWRYVGHCKPNDRENLDLLSTNNSEQEDRSNSDIGAKF